MSLAIRFIARCDRCPATLPVQMPVPDASFGQMRPLYQADGGASPEGWRLPHADNLDDLATGAVLCPKCSEDRR